MAVYITGDCHQDMRKIYTFADRMDLGPDDHVIVLGDMGIFWRHDKADAKVIIKDFEARFNFNLYFIDGNHENFKILNSLEEDEKHMGIVSEHIKHLKRGRRYNIGGKDILTIGGADSVDKFRRTEGLSWWKEELPSVEEMEEGRVNLQKHNNKVAFIVTHCASSSTAALLSNGIYKPDLLTDYLEEIRQTVKFKKWFFGHYHDNRNVNVEEILLWEQIIRIS